jgi:hypothetical protein
MSLHLVVVLPMAVGMGYGLRRITEWDFVHDQV